MNKGCWGQWKVPQTALGGVWARSWAGRVTASVPGVSGEPFKLLCFYIHFLRGNGVVVLLTGRAGSDG